jgi:hypothetical protein
MTVAHVPQGTIVCCAHLPSIDMPHSRRSEQSAVLINGLVLANLLRVDMEVTYRLSATSQEIDSVSCPQKTT